MSYKDASLPVENRVEDLLAQMTLEEKVSQLFCIMPHMLIGAGIPDPEKMKSFMGNGLGRMTQFSMMFINGPEQIAEFANKVQKFVLENTRLGIPVLIQNEALNGFTAVGAANFPTPIGLASTWEPDLLEQAAIVIRKQMRSVGVHQALAPVIDLAQDPRWGRVHETYGEDPYLTSALAAAFVHGLQGDDLKTGVIACAKHFLGYSIPQAGLNMAAVRIGERELYETFARPFETAIHESDMGSLMVTYSEINGQPVSVNKAILRDLLRTKMGFTGSAICDGGSIELAYSKQHVAKDLQEAAIMAIEAGLDADTPITEAYYELIKAVENGLVDVSYVDEAVRRVLSAKFSLGLFENPFVEVKEVSKVYKKPEQKQLSRTLAEHSIVLLKNEGNLLPLEKGQTIAVIGPHADSVRDSLFAGYTFPVAIEMMKNLLKGGKASMQGVADKVANSGDRSNRVNILQLMKHFGRLVTIGQVNNYIEKEYGSLSLLKAIEISKGKKVLYARGCDILDTSTEGFQEAINAARKADVVVMALGGKSGWGENSTCGEGRDASTIELMGVQQELLETIYATGKPIVLVLFDGRPLALPWAAEHIPAIVQAWFPGEEGGKAVSNVLFGDVNPGGKLPVTVPRSVGQVPIFYYHKAGSGYKTLGDDGITGMLGHGYVNESEQPLYPFGHGLSYTQFEFRNLEINPQKIDSSGSVFISCSVKNVGKFAGSEVVQLYFHDREAHVTRPVQELVGFKRIQLNAGEECKVSFIVKMNQLGFYNEHMQFVVEPGNMDVFVGASSADIRLQDSFEITGSSIEVLGKRSYISQASVTRLQSL